MDVVLRFNPAKTTYGFMFELARFTKSNKTLKEIKDAINQYDLSDNFEDVCKGLPDTIESNETASVSWKRNIKAMIALNKHSSYAINYCLAGDEDLIVRASTAQFTRFTSLITFLSNNSEEPKVLIGLLKNPHLNGQQFKAIYKRLMDGLLEEILVRHEDDCEVLVNGCLLRSCRLTDKEKEDLSSFLEECWNRLATQGRK